MKAKEYYAKYVDRICSDDYYTAINDMFKEMFVEVNDIANMRHARSDQAAISIIEEQNTKWNAVVSLVEKSGKPCMMKRNGFKAAAMKLINKSIDRMTANE